MIRTHIKLHNRGGLYDAKREQATGDCRGRKDENRLLGGVFRDLDSDAPTSGKSKIISLTKEEKESLKQKYIGRRIVLDRMDDKQSPEVGTQADVEGVDDAGDLLCRWDNGSSLKIVLSEDEFHIIETDRELETSLQRLSDKQKKMEADDFDACPRCGNSFNVRRGAISRLDHRIHICNECGTQEALIDAWEHLDGFTINLNGANPETEKNLKRKLLTDWWIVHRWRGEDDAEAAL